MEIAKDSRIQIGLLTVIRVAGGIILVRRSRWIMLITLNQGHVGIDTVFRRGIPFDGRRGTALLVTAIIAPSVGSMGMAGQVESKTGRRMIAINEGASAHGAMVVAMTLYNGVDARLLEE